MKRSRSSSSDKKGGRATLASANNKSKRAVRSAQEESTSPMAPPKPIPSAQRGPCRSALLVVGNYHAVMAGLVLKKEKFYLKFAIKHHVGNVNDVAVTDRYVASCGADERVFLFTNKAEQKLTAVQRAKLQAAGETMPVRLADLGSLTPPCEVLCLGFTNGSQYLLCGCVDGSLLVYRCRDWSVSNSLSVHERGLVSFAIHPGSGGALVVSVGADRSVAVLDLSKGRLLTKWKYTPVIATQEEVEEEDDEASSESSEGESEDKENGGEKEKPEKRARKNTKKDSGEANPLARLFAREEPIKVVFSPAGTRFLIQARFSLVVYSSTTMEPIRAIRLSQPPQPQEEIHSVTFLDEDTILVGNESAQILYTHLTDEAPSATEACPLKPVEVVYPEAVRPEAAALLATPIRMDAEVKKKNPLRHVSRVKSLNKVRDTLFSLDSNAIIFSWGVHIDEEDGAVTLTYVTSANCQGRATSMSVLQL